MPVFRQRLCRCRTRCCVRQIGTSKAHRVVLRPSWLRTCLMSYAIDDDRKNSNRPKRPISPTERASTSAPKEADGTRFGDWEMDLIVDGQQHVILTLVERSTNMLMMERIPTGKKAEPIAKAVTRLLMSYRGTIKTITTDNGSEFAAHHLITKGLYMRGKEDVIVYFTDAYSSWQKGCIENTNKLIRKYIPKQANFNLFSDAYIKKIQKKLNQRPREKLNFSTPKNCFFKHFP